jgi:hypothetical protein
MEGFVKRSDAWTRKTREMLDEARGKKAYEALLTRKICPECRHPDGKLVYQAYDEFLEKRDCCTVCGQKYVRQLAWDSVKDGFFAASAKYVEMKEQTLAQLRKKKVSISCKKLVYDATDNVTRKVNLFKTCKDESEQNECWEAFYGRTAADMQARHQRLSELQRMQKENVIRLDPECTFEPQLADLEADALAFPHLREMSDRLKFQGFVERMANTLARRAENKYMSDLAAPDETQLPDYMNKNASSWPSEFKRGDTKPTGENYGVSDIIGGGAPAVAPGKTRHHHSAASKSEGKEESKSGYFGRGRVSGNGWIEY